MRRTAFILCLLAILAFPLIGCDGMFFGGERPDLVKPTIAVMKFENRAGGFMGWNLSDGMRDVMVDRLVATKRYHVVERPELQAVAGELKLQHSGITREHGRAEQGRLKNCQYLIKGTVTDFGHTSSTGGFFASLGWALSGGGNKAVMSITIYVVDVESGEIICSESIQESVHAGTADVKATYTGLSFGGRQFATTPLGEATRKVIEQAIRKITAVIASRPWEAKVAAVHKDGSVIINGGADRKIDIGARYAAVSAGTPIIDPDTGDVIGQQPGKAVAHLEVYEVQDRYSLARLTAGKIEDVQVGQRCRGVEKK